MKNYLLLLLLLSSCEDKKGDKEILTPSMGYEDSYSEFYLDSLLLSVKETGDTILFKEACDISAYYHKDSDKILFYKLIMAHKYNYPEAYYNIFYFYKSMSSEDRDFEKVGIYYLLKSYEKGYKPAIKDIKYIFGDSIIPNSDAFLKVSDEFNNIKIPVY